MPATKAELSKRRMELQAELDDSMAAIIREANPRTLRALARDLDEDAAFHRGMVRLQTCPREELDAACRELGIAPNRREVDVPKVRLSEFWTPERLARLKLPPPAEKPAAAVQAEPQPAATARWSRLFSKLSGLADAVGIGRTQLWKDRASGRIIVRREPGFGWRVRVNGFPPEVVAKLEPCIDE